eukprot:symbB.v1.2.029199.t3/scaffold3170.1/size62039/3
MERVSAVGYGLFGPGCPWQGPAVTTGQLCKVAYSSGPPRRCAVLQSSAAVHRGCSGGALVAVESGQLLGMVTTNVKQQDGSVMPHVNFILPITLLTPICTYLENLKVLPAQQALKRLTEELRFSAANEEEQGLWRLDTETLDFPSRMVAKKRHALQRLDQLQKEAEEEVERQQREVEQPPADAAAQRSKLFGELSDCYVPPGNKGIAFVSYKDPSNASSVVANQQHEVKPGQTVIAAPAFDRPTPNKGGGKGAVAMGCGGCGCACGSFGAPCGCGCCDACGCGGCGCCGGCCGCGGCCDMGCGQFGVGGSSCSGFIGGCMPGMGMPGMGVQMGPMAPMGGMAPMAGPMGMQPSFQNFAMDGCGVGNLNSGMGRG